MRRLALLLGWLPLVALAPVPAARAEDAPAKPEKKETDDEKIFADWKLCKMRGFAHNRKRAEYWAGKGTSGKDLLWLGKMWARGEEYGKAVEAFEAFLAWKAPEADQATNQKNRPLAYADLVDVHFKARDYAKSVAAGQKLREEYGDSQPPNVIAEYGWFIPGHAARLSGDEAKALELFTKAAELKYVGGVLELVDVHLAAGRVDQAKAALAQHAAGAEKGGKEFEWMKSFLDAVGSAAPALDQGKNVGTSDAPAAWSKATVLYLWGMQTGMADRALRNLEVMRRPMAETVDVIGIATYKKYNPVSSKVEEGMTEDDEIALYKRMISETFATPQPPHLVVKPDWLEAAHLKWDRQYLVVDKDGKLRYARLNQEKAWDQRALEKALEQITGAAAPK